MGFRGPGLGFRVHVPAEREVRPIYCIGAWTVWAAEICEICGHLDSGFQRSSACP